MKPACLESRYIDMHVLKLTHSERNIVRHVIYDILFIILYPNAAKQRNVVSAKNCIGTKICINKQFRGWKSVPLPPLNTNFEKRNSPVAVSDTGVDRCTRKSCSLLFGYIDLLSSEASTIRKLILTESEYLKLQRVDFIGLINKAQPLRDFLKIGLFNPRIKFRWPLMPGD